ncbi:MAG TPA: type IV pilin protein [Gammaproteobacteria bacterium]
MTVQERISRRGTRLRAAGRAWPSPLSRAAGVTLVELMVVVVLIAILGLIAVPSYRAYTQRAHRTEAKSALLRLQANQERWYLQNNTYTADPEALGFTGDKTENGVYSLSITAAAGGLTEGYTATATPAAGGGTNGVDMTDDDECASFSIDSQGVRDASPDPNGRCW